MTLRQYTCAAPDCSEKAACSSSLGPLCKKHYGRFKKHGVFDVKTPRKRTIIVAGQRFGRWTILGQGPTRKGRDTTVLTMRCRCDCGTEKLVAAVALRSGASRSCGCRELTKAEDRFWKFVQKGRPDECWPWTGGNNRLGYGRFRIGRKTDGMAAAHRFIYESIHGALPSHLVVMHKCDNPSCVNPAHLQAGTYRDNTIDAINKGRAKGQFKPGFDPRRRSA